MVPLDLHVDEEVEVLFRHALARLSHDLLHRLDVTHDAGDHQRGELLDPNLARLEVSNEHSLVEQDRVLALERLIDIHGGFKTSTSSRTCELVLPRIAAHDLLLLFLALRRLEEAVAAEDLRARLKTLIVVAGRHGRVSGSTLLVLVVTEVFLYEEVHFDNCRGNRRFLNFLY